MARGYLKYKAYPFVDKDPVIDLLRTLMRDEEMTIREIYDGGGPTTTTLRNWFGGKTRRPQFATVAAAGVALGVSSIPLTSAGRKLMKNGK